MNTERRRGRNKGRSILDFSEEELDRLEQDVASKRKQKADSEPQQSGDAKHES